MSAWLQPLRSQRLPLCTFATIWGASALWLAARGQGKLVLASLGIAALLGVLCALTLRWTEPAGADLERSARGRTILWIQLLLLALVVGITLWRGLLFHQAVDPSLEIPLWSAGERKLVDVLGKPAIALINPIEYCLIPLLFLLPLTGRRYLGLGRGHRVLRVTALWCALPLAYIAFQVATGSLSLLSLAKRLLSHTIQNGPVEEFLFHGAVQSRITALLGSGWGVVLSSLAFGVWHLGLGYAQTGKNSLLDGLASTVLIQATMGLGFGLIFHRTRNLVAGSIVHVVGNSVG